MNPLFAVARLVVAVAVSVAIAAPASAGRQFARQVHGCAQVVQQAVIQPAYNHTPYASATYNFVGAPVRLQAEQAYAMKNDPQWQQFQQWKAQQQTQQMAQALFQQWSAAQGQPAAQPPQQTVASGYAAGLRPAQPGEPGAFPTYDEATRQPTGNWVKQAQSPTCPPGQECPPPGMEGQPLPPGVEPPAAPGATAPGTLPPPVPGVPNAATPDLQPHAAKMPLLIQYCGRCHTTEKPAGEFAFDGSVDYLIKGEGPAAEEMARKRDQILQAIVSQRMPKDGALEPMVAGAIVYELYSGE